MAKSRILIMIKQEKFFKNSQIYVIFLKSRQKFKKGGHKVILYTAGNVKNF